MFKIKIIIVTAAFISPLFLLAQTDTTTKNPTETPTMERNLQNEQFIGQDALDDIGKSQDYAGILSSGKDPFDAAASFIFSDMYFHPRGYQSSTQAVYLNGMPMAKLERGTTSFYQWGGLNDLFRNSETFTTLESPTFGKAGVGSSTNYDLHASTYRRGCKVGYLVSNKTYTHRVTFSGGTGLMKNGWAIAGGLAARFGKEGYFEGMPYQSYAFFTSFEKTFGKHSLSLVMFGSPSKRGMNSAAVEEVYDILGKITYNPNWGYQGNKKRNAKMRTYFEPVAMLNYNWNINETSALTATFGAQFGRTATSALNWYDAPDPRPDYYRWLPGYQTDPLAALAVLHAWQADASKSQINWDELYQVNYLAAGDGEQAKYILENRVTDFRQFALSATYNKKFNKYSSLDVGLNVVQYHSNNYKTILDLLGGTHWVDVDQFAERDFPADTNVLQNDLDHPNRVVKEGDKYGYDYNADVWNEVLWARLGFVFSKVEFFLGGQSTFSQFWRTGNMRNGRYPDNSLGKSEMNHFIAGGLNAGFTAKLPHHQFIILHVLAQSEAPTFANTYISPRVQNAAVDSLKYQTTFSADINYIVQHPRVKMRLTGYYTHFWDATSIRSFYHDDYRTFVQQVLTGVNTRHIGVEAGIEVKIIKWLSFFAAGNYGDYRYVSRPNALITAENTSFEDVQKQIYLKNFYVTGGPQAAVTAGLKVATDNMWFVEISANYYDKIYLDVNPERRTVDALNGLTMTENEELIHNIIDQPKVKGQFTMDASVGKSFYLKKARLNVNFSVDNILNNKQRITNGFEQSRFDFTEHNVDKFPPKVYYAAGTTFALNVSVSF